MFTTDYKKYLFPNDTEFEMVIKSTDTGKSKVKHTPYIQLQLSVREDIHEDYSGYPDLNERIYQIKGEYPTRKLNAIAKACGIPEGTSFKDEYDFIEAIEGKPVKITMKKEFDDYREEEVNRAGYFQQTEHPFKTIEKSKPKEKEKEKEMPDVNEDELPW